MDSTIFNDDAAGPRARGPLASATGVPAQPDSGAPAVLDAGGILSLDERRRWRPDPRTVLLLVLVGNALVMTRGSFLLAVIVVLVAALALVSNGRVKLALGIIVVESFWMFKLCAAAALAGYALTVLVPGELVAALRALRIPVAVTAPITVLLRFLPIVVSEYRAVREAMALRGLAMGWSAVFHPLRYLEFILVPLLSSCARIADDMTAAGTLRGLGSRTRPTSLHRLRFSWVDALWLAVIAALIVARYYLANISFTPGGVR
ncbi:energy-coupling factor transporter transmembrane component T family protein [Actinotignum sp. GS-2025b]|uniref:energy-coupling factor transporter transmembrane component T family protein n=1 Tax=Actinotignum sp. GS-2025b TaxID=3427275 RepID=UPI003F48E583